MQQRQANAIEPHLVHGGRCGEAIEFRKRALVAELLFPMCNEDAREPQLPGALPSGSDGKVPHAMLRIRSMA